MHFDGRPVHGDPSFLEVNVGDLQRYSLAPAQSAVPQRQHERPMRATGISHTPQLFLRQVAADASRSAAWQRVDAGGRVAAQTTILDGLLQDAIQHPVRAVHDRR